MAEGQSLKRYVMRRAINAIPTIFGVIILVFFLIQFAPGDPVYVFITEGSTPELVQALRVKFALDKPIYERFFSYMINVLKGDFGYSTFYNSPALDIILSKIPNTVLLMGVSLLIGTSVGILIGVLSARKTSSFSDSIMTLLSISGVCLPQFWLGQLLILFFAVYLGLLPAQGMTTVRLAGHLSGPELVIDVLRHMILPVTTLSIYLIAVTSRITRTGVLEAITQNYIVAARARGLNERTVFMKHALRNALLSVATVVGINIGYFFVAGSVVIETVFNWPGVGRLVFDSIMRRDLPILIGCFVFISVTVTVVNLVVDILYAYLDPRIKYRR